MTALPESMHKTGLKYMHGTSIRNDRVHAKIQESIFGKAITWVSV